MEYKSHMKDIEIVYNGAQNWLKKIPGETQARHLFDNTIKVENITNNLSKAFNIKVGKNKAIPIVILLKKIRLKLMDKFHGRFVQSTGWETKTTPYMRKLLDKSIKNGKNMRMILVSNVEYQVCDGQIKLCIDLDKKNYFCGE